MTKRVRPEGDACVGGTSGELRRIRAERQLLNRTLAVNSWKWWDKRIKHGPALIWKQPTLSLEDTRSKLKQLLISSGPCELVKSSEESAGKVSENIILELQLYVRWDINRTSIGLLYLHPCSIRTTCTGPHPTKKSSKEELLVTYTFIYCIQWLPLMLALCNGTKLIKIQWIPFLLPRSSPLQVIQHCRDQRKACINLGAHSEPQTHTCVHTNPIIPVMPSYSSRRFWFFTLSLWDKLWITAIYCVSVRVKDTYPLFLRGYKSLEAGGHAEAQLVNKWRLRLAVDLHSHACLKGCILWKRRQEGGAQLAHLLKSIKRQMIECFTLNRCFLQLCEVPPTKPEASKVAGLMWKNVVHLSLRQMKLNEITFITGIRSTSLHLHSHSHTHTHGRGQREILHLLQKRE